RWRPLLPTAVFGLLSERSHRPAEVVAVQAEVAQRHVHLPALAEPIRLAGLAGAAVAVGAVLPLQVRRADRPASQQRCHRRRRPPGSACLRPPPPSGPPPAAPAPTPPGVAPPLTRPFCRRLESVA